ncbi:MAG TPA: type IV pili methyl-accepting chemotaxis transducer N-terminal domain-containing protein [Cellvibrionaceae bacterium]
MLATVFGKYKTLVISIALFLLLDASVLGVNFYTSFQIAADAKTVNLAGRQRMLSQRMVKSLLEVEKSLAQGQSAQQYLNELLQAAQIFGQTLSAFEQGGTATGVQGEAVLLAPIKPGAGRDALIEAKELWQPLKQLIAQILTQKTPENINQSVSLSMDYARTNNLQLLNLMNWVTLDLERVAGAKATQLRLIQSVAIVLAILNFILILYHFLGQLRRSDRALDAARKEMQHILSTVNEGLFLLDSDLRMGSQHSAKLEQMFCTQPGAVVSENCYFGDFLRERVRPKDLETAQRFVNLLFKKNIKSSLIGDLNPLTKVEINIAEEGGGFTTKYMHFDFCRVLNEGAIKQVLVTVTDVSKEVLLGKKLDESRAENAQQIEMLTGILHANPYVLRLFIQSAFDSFNRINELFRLQDKSSIGIDRKLRDIFVEIHNFKAEAASLSLSSVASLAHELESTIQNLLDQPVVNGADLFGAIVLLEKLIYYIEGIEALMEKVARLSAAQAEPTTVPLPATRGRWQHLHTLAQVLAQRHKKKLVLHLTGFNEIDMISGQARLINDMCLQFIRNAVVHGIEQPQMRVLCKKAEVGRIDLNLIRLADGGIELQVRDDGRGVDYDKIRNQAISMGLAKADELRQWNNKQIIGLMFKPGFTTADDSSGDAGRGIGMDVIISRVQRMKGSIKIASRSGQACQFIVTLPGVYAVKSKAA